jgi:hypothetical protein
LTLVVKVLVMAKTAACAMARNEPFFSSGPSDVPESMAPGEMAFSRRGVSSTVSDRVTAFTELLAAATTRKPGFGSRAVTPENTTNAPVFGAVGVKCLASVIGPTTFAWEGSKITVGLVLDL